MDFLRKRILGLYNSCILRFVCLKVKYFCKMFSHFSSVYLHVKYGQTCNTFSVDCKILYKKWKNVLLLKSW